MARIAGREYRALRAVFRAECAAKDLPCWICGQPIAYDVPDSSTDDSFELDHYYPVSTHPDKEFDPANFRPSNRLCNRSRGNSTPAPPINNRSRNWDQPAPEGALDHDPQPEPQHPEPARVDPRG